MADDSKSSGKKPIPSYRAMTIQEEYRMLSTPRSTSGTSSARDSAPAPSLAVVEAQPLPHAQIFPGQPGNPIDADHPPPLIPTSVLRDMINQSTASKFSRRLRGISPGDIPPAIPRSQSGPRHVKPIDRMNLVDEENAQSDSDDEDYVPPESLKASSFIPDLTPEEIEGINAVAGTPPVTEEAAAPADVLAEVTVTNPPCAVVSPSPAKEIPASSSPSIPHTDFFSEENTAPPQPLDYVPDSSSESSDRNVSLANFVIKRRAKESGSQFVKSSDDENPDDSADEDFDGNVVGDVVSTSDSSNSSFEEEDAAQVLTSMPAEQSPPSDDVDKMIDDYEPEVAAEDDVNIAAIAPHSNKFLTAEAEVKFADLMEQSMIDEKRIMIDVFKKHNLIDLFELKGMLATVTTVVPFVREIVCEFYANLLPQVSDKNSVSYGRAYVRGHIYSFTPERINLIMGTEDYHGPSTVDDMDEAVIFLTRGKVSKWQEKLSAARLTSMYSVLHKIAVFNWLPSKNSTIVTRPQAQLLYRLGNGIKFNFGQMVFDCVTKLAQPNSGSSLIFPSLIFNMLELQKVVAWGSDVFTGDPGSFTIRTHLLQGDRLCDLPWVDRRKNISEGGVGSSASNMASNFCQFSRSEVEVHIARLEAQKKDIQLMIDALKASLLPSGQGGEYVEDEEAADPEEEDVANVGGNMSNDDEPASADELEAAFLRARKGKGKMQEKGKRKRAAEKETSLPRSSRHRRN